MKIQEDAPVNGQGCSGGGGSRTLHGHRDFFSTCQPHDGGDLFRGKGKNHYVRDSLMHGKISRITQAFDAIIKYVFLANNFHQLGCDIHDMTSCKCLSQIAVVIILERESRKL